MANMIRLNGLLQTITMSVVVENP
uniref:Uncharacterized protein n=1 Tax=Acrobeloides nanus TaxID=290746 RepID=A0A914DNB7_9BILA